MILKHLWRFCMFLRGNVSKKLKCSPWEFLRIIDSSLHLTTNTWLLTSTIAYLCTSHPQLLTPHHLPTTTTILITINFISTILLPYPSPHLLAPTTTYLPHHHHCLMPLSLFAFIFLFEKTIGFQILLHFINCKVVEFWHFLVFQYKM